MPFQVRCALDLELPDPARYAELVEDWLVRGSAELAGHYRAEAESGPPMDASSVRRGGACGPPGSVWGFLNVTRAAAGARQSSRVYSVKNVGWLLKQIRELDEQPAEATLGLVRLDERGFPDGRTIRISADRVMDAPDWLTLSVVTSENRLDQPGFQHSLLAFVRSVADRTNPVYGQCDFNDGLDKTAVERTVGPPWRMVRDTVPAGRSTLRGYAWLTVCPQEIADRLGGPDALRASGAFHEVEQLAAGGVWLLATAGFRDYDPAAVERVFEAVAPVLPVGMPQDFSRPGRPPDLIALRDAATAGPRK